MIDRLSSAPFKSPLQKMIKKDIKINFLNVKELLFILFKQNRSIWYKIVYVMRILLDLSNIYLLKTQKWQYLTNFFGNLQTRFTKKYKTYRHTILTTCLLCCKTKVLQHFGLLPSVLHPVSIPFFCCFFFLWDRFLCGIRAQIWLDGFQ